MGVDFVTRVLGIVLCLSGCGYAAQWSYKGEHGPHSWHELFPKACSGQMQSPIDIKPERTLYDPSLKDFAIWYDPPRPGSRMTALNNGHAVQVNLQGDFFVTNGGLPNVYRSVQFHFHWGHENVQGSEHTIDGTASPLELHIVSYNSDKYVDIVDAVTQPQGLAVLGVLFEVTSEENKALKPFTDALDFIQEPDDGQVEITPMSLRDLLPEDISRYYRYNGSLTTPGCFESVVWTVFDMKQTISHHQLMKFRQTLQHRRRKHKKGGHHRHRRSAGRVRRAERQAEAVLEELGIKDDKLMEAELKMEMMEGAAHAHPTPELPAAEDASAATEAANMDGHGHHEPHYPPPSVRLDENAAKKADENMMQHYKEQGESELEAEVEAAKEALKEDEELAEYIQEVLVDNFRPVQPLNGRLVYRSFKLSAPPAPREMEDTEVVEIDRMEPAYTRVGQTSGPENAGSEVRFSVLAVVTATLLAFFRNVLS